MNKRSARFSIVIICFALSGRSASAQLLPPRASAQVIVHPAATAADQLKQAATLQRKIYLAQTPETRFNAIAETIENLKIIQKLWPNEKNAVLQSAIVLGDVTLEWHLPNVAIDTLKNTVTLAAKTDFEPGVELRLAEAYSQLLQLDEAETHFSAAERSLHSARSNAAEVHAVLTASARFYAAGRKNPREAIKRYRQLSEWPDENATLQVVAALESARLAIGLNEPDQATAKQELASLDRHITVARGSNLKPDDATMVETVAREAAHLRKAIR